jgi:hypothetical protein
MQLGLRVSKARLCITEVSVGVQAATMRSYSTALAQLTTPGHGYRGDMTRHDGTMVRAMFSVAKR